MSKLMKTRSLLILLDLFLEADWGLQRCRSPPTRGYLRLIPFGRPAHTRRNKQKRAPNPEFSPISASTFFVDAAQVEVPSRNLDCRVYYTPPKFADGTVMVCHHGAGYSGLSFACFAKEVSDITKDECGVLALDARRHGQ